MRLSCSAACAPGLEPLVAAELTALGVRPGPAGSGLVPFTATVRQLYAACLRSAVASRVLVRVARFPARTFADLEREAAAVDWAPWTAGGGTFRVTAVKSRLSHTAAVAERLERAVGAVSPALKGGSGPGPAQGHRCNARTRQPIRDADAKGTAAGAGDRRRQRRAHGGRVGHHLRPAGRRP